MWYVCVCTAGGIIDYTARHAGSHGTVVDFFSFFFVSTGDMSSFVEFILYNRNLLF